MSADVDRDDDLGPGRDLLLDLLIVNVEGALLDIAHDNGGAHMMNNGSRCRVGIGRNNYFVAGPHAVITQHKLQR